uniref:Cytochrome b6-f complex subunit 6 n=1 Tax=Wildemania schizophylla TaxID=1134705 RepID=A0A126G1U4_WILSC|nr:cytochrome b6/f complex subunit VI [Wildemania schizophylla]AKS28364.1 cytochrome b6/f complex subunit VI [Wildemania schizophylla]
MSVFLGYIIFLVAFFGLATGLFLGLRAIKLI